MSEDPNPYATPSSEVKPPPHGSAGPLEPPRLPGRAGVDWLVRGWGYFMANPPAWMGVSVVLVLINIGLSLVPVIGSVATSVLSPVFTAGLMLGCRAVHTGEGFRFGHLFSAFSSPRFGRLAGVGGLYLAMVFGVILAAGLLFGLFAGFGLMAPGDPTGAAGAGIDQPLLLIPALLVAGLLVPAVMAMWFAPALVIFDNLDAVAAMIMSFRACARNLWPFLVYGLVILIGGAVLALPLVLLGTAIKQAVALFPLLLVLLLVPTVTASIFAAYTDVFRGPSSTRA